MVKHYAPWHSRSLALMSSGYSVLWKLAEDCYYTATAPTSYKCKTRHALGLGLLVRMAPIKDSCSVYCIITPKAQSSVSREYQRLDWRFQVSSDRYFTEATGVVFHMRVQQLLLSSRSIFPAPISRTLALTCEWI